MAILFDFYESPPQEGEGNKLNVHARPVLTKTTSTERLAARIEERCSLTRTDIIAALDSLGRIMGEQLSDGERVYLNGIGYFSVSLECDEIRTRKDMRADRVHVKSIQFRADMDLKSRVLGAKMKRAAYKSHSARLSDEEVDRRVDAFFKDHPVMARRDLQRICQVKDGVAYKHIHRLLEAGKIKNIGINRQPVYIAVNQNQDDTTDDR